MKILLADSGATMRGGQWQTLYLAQGLFEAGGEVRLLARAGSPLYNRALGQGFAPEDATSSVLREAARWADVVHVQDARSHTLAALFSRKPLIVSRRVAFAVGRGPASRWKYGRAAQFVAVSRYVADVLQAAGISPEKIAIVHDGVPLPSVAPGPFEWRSVPLLGLRTGDRDKGDDLLASAARIAGVEVRWTDDLAGDLPRARVFAYITRSEGLGSAALLAMSYGAPVAASRTGGLEEIVEDGVTGVLTDNEPEAIAACVRRLLDNPALAARLSAAASKRAVERFSVERMVRETVEVYRKVLA